MAISPITILKERRRRVSADDANFVKKMIYFFELRVPSEIAFQPGETSYIFPLMLGPNAYSISAPFTVEKTPTQGGGLFVEENGIIMRTIRLKGHTGFKPRRLPGNAPNALGVLSPDQRSFGRVLPTFALTEVSGQRHFQYLQDAIFNIYGDLKKDPATARGTELFFHNPKDKESWLVVPDKFDCNRSADTRILYEYDIELTTVDKADASRQNFSEDKDLLDRLKDGIAEVKGAIDGISGFINDITKTVGEIKSFVNNIDKVLDGVFDILTAANDFVDGVTDLIEAPAALVKSVSEGIERVSDTLVNTVSQVRSIPSAYINTWNNLESAVNRLGQFPSLFETDAQKVLRIMRLNQQVSQITIDRANQATAPATIDDFGRLGTGPLPGTADRAKATRVAGRGVNAYTSARARQISEGDTLVSLASSFLGDARLWQDIATLNGLKAPYIDSMGGVNLGGPDNPLPGVLGIGSDILIPDFGRAPQALPLLPILGVSQEEPFPVQVLGTDFQLDEVDGLFQWVVDTDHGGSDLKKVSGVANLSQALKVRLSVERGHNPMYRFVGLSRVIGLNNAAVDQETARFRVIETISNDPRVSTVRRIDFEAVADALNIDADVEVRGFSQGVNVRAIGVS